MAEQWIRCTQCGHKLFILNNQNAKVDLSIKCHSCKSIEHILIGMTKNS